MAAPLYARYIPSKPKIADKPESQKDDGIKRTSLDRSTPLGGSLKRKRREDDTGRIKKSKKDKKSTLDAPEAHTKVDDTDIGAIKKKPKKVDEEPRPRVKSKKEERGKRHRDNHDPSHGHLHDVEQGFGSDIRGPDEQQSAESLLKEHDDKLENDVKKTVGEKSRSKAKDKGKKQPEDTAQTVVPDNADSNLKNDAERHTAIFSKYAKAMKGPKATIPDSGEAEQTAVEPEQVHDLVPIPMPERTAQGTAFSAESALPSWLSKAVKVAGDSSSTFEALLVAPSLVAQLQKNGLKQALPVQVGVLPLLLPNPTQHPGDLCVSAATGSGKTLAYILPIMQSLMKLVTPALRAVIVVPTRELVTQVRDTAELFTAGTGLKIATALGAKRLEEEQVALVAQETRFDYKSVNSKSHIVESSETLEDGDADGNDDFPDLLRQSVRRELPHRRVEHSSKVDILICTPGRLVDHIRHTVGFNISQLEWLVIDEADRLLDASFQEWVDTVNTGLAQPIESTAWDSCIANGILLKEYTKTVRKVILSATMTRDLEKLASLNLRNPRMVSLSGTNDPSTSTAVNAEATENSLNLPKALSEYGVPVGSGSDKPLYFVSLLDDILNGTETWRARATAKKKKSATLADQLDDASNTDPSSSELSSSDGDSDSDSSDDLLSQSQSPSPSPSTPHESSSLQKPNVLIFTASNESAHRLAHVLTHLRPTYGPLLSTITKSSTSRTTLKVISSFRTDKLRIIIATDRASRGLDLPNLANVINYDIPHSITSYVHRVGRTARAGKEGKAWTLVEDREARWFWKEVAKGTVIARHDSGVQRVNIGVDKLDDADREDYAEALRALQIDVKDSRK